MMARTSAIPICPPCLVERREDQIKRDLDFDDGFEWIESERMQKPCCICERMFVPDYYLVASLIPDS